MIIEINYMRNTGKEKNQNKITYHEGKDIQLPGGSIVWRAILQLLPAHGL